MGKRTPRQRAIDDIGKAAHLLNRAVGQMERVLESADSEGVIDSKAFVQLYALLRRVIASTTGPLAVVLFILGDMTDDEFHKILGKIKETQEVTKV